MHIVLQPGIAFLESGFVRPKNAVDVAFRKYLVTGINISKLYYEKLNFICLQITAISALTYFLTGFALAFGDGNGFFGYDYFALVDLPDDKLAMCFYQYSFAATAATIPSGVVHERSSGLAFLLYTALTSGRLYNNTFICNNLYINVIEIKLQDSFTPSLLTGQQLKTAGLPC